MKSSIIILIIFVSILGGFFIHRLNARLPLPKGETTPFVDEELVGTHDNIDIEVGLIDGIAPLSEADTSSMLISLEEPTVVSISKKLISLKSEREIFVTDNIKHSIPLDEIRQGCYGRDCIPSVDDPEFISVTEADKLLPEDTIGIGLVYKGETRFYPFNMLVTKEIVNDVVAGDPLLVTYCPLCGTGIVFEREINGEIFVFGVSGMLWQSNLLMYNRNSDEDKISLWSQVLGEAVLGIGTGTKLSIVRSDIVRYVDWRESHTLSRVLNTGQIGDPYRGNYYSVARSFSPSFDEASSPIPPTTYVLGIEVGGKYKAYKKNALRDGTTLDTFGGLTLKIEKKVTGEVSIADNKTGEVIPIIEGFWFSWVAVHPETELLK